MNSAGRFPSTVPTIFGLMGIGGEISMDQAWAAYGFKKNSDSEIYFETGMPGAGGRNDGYLFNQFIEVKMYT